MDTPRVASGLEELVAGATDRSPLRTADAKSGATFERLTIDGERYFLKSWSYDSDWITRVIDDREHWPFKVWRAGIYQQAPACIDHTIVAMASEGTGHADQLHVLMRDVGECLIAEGDAPVATDIHVGLITDMAVHHATGWGWQDDIGLMPLRNRFRCFAPEVIGPELSRSDPSPVVTIADAGWNRLADVEPDLFQLLRGVHQRPDALAAALARTPCTFVAGDWKMGNLGRTPDGRTILLDWAYPGRAPGCWELGWYLALNRARLPISKEATIEAYRDALSRAGVAVHDWFDVQLDLSLFAVAACFGWEKALGDTDELGWWRDRALRGAARLTA